MSLITSKFTPCANAEETPKKPWRKGRTPKKEKQKVLKAKMEECLTSTYKGKKNQLCDGIGKLIKSDYDHDGIFGKDDVVNILKKVPSSKKRKRRSLLQEIVDENSKKHLSVVDLIHLEENFSGTRLVEELRRLLPGVIPSQRDEREQKSTYWREFLSILKPQRTATGWRIDPSQLIDLLSFKYYWVEGPKYWKVYGDGREIGGRQSTFIAISILNNEASLHGVSYHDPTEVYPLAIFYEKDSRDNLEENCGNWLPRFLAEKSKRDHHFYLCGDEMFLEAVLDGSGILAPNSKSGWNIYVNMESDAKGITNNESGFRTDLSIELSRHHPHHLFPSIPITNVVMCIMHGFTRSVEKLLTLEVEDILSEATKVRESGLEKSAYIDTKISALVGHINKRGVKQGGFSITFDKNGKLCPIKLNKDHAVTILSPPPLRLSDMYPHVLEGVCSLRTVKNTLPISVRTSLKLPDEYNNFELVAEVWKHFFSMYEIMKKDPEPILKIPTGENTQDPRDYSFGYTLQDKADYKYHAECFFQLYKLRYGTSQLTPYMMKFIDVAPILMDSLPFSLGRFQNEGGEHANYLHNRFYFHHTTRHGGSNRVDPILALFNSMYKRISYAVDKGDGSSCGMKAAEAMNEHIKQHVRSSGIPKGIKAADIEKYVGVQVSMNQKEGEGIFHTLTFSLCGAIPRIDGQSYSHNSFQALVKNESGKIKDKLPAVCDSTKTYVVLVNPSIASKSNLPSALRLAMKAGYPILDYKFVIDCIKEKYLLDMDKFRVDLSRCSLKVIRQQSLENKHFRCTHVMTSLIKKRSMNQRRKPKPLRTRECNPAFHFVWSKIKKLKVSRKEARLLMPQYFQQWKMMSRYDRDLYRRHCENLRYTVGRSVKYRVQNPAYAHLISH